MSIKIKIIAGLVLVFALLLGAINVFMYENIRITNEKAIQKDLYSIKGTGQFYVKQDLLINNATISEDSFSSAADDIVGDLSKATNIYFAAYSLGGQLLSSNNETVFQKVSDEELMLALKGQIAYTITTAGGKTTAVFSFPVVLNGQKIGILRCVNDYTAIYTQSDKSIRQINIITLSGLAVCLLFSLVLSRSVIAPIGRICNNLKISAADIQENKLDPAKMRDHLKLTRRDELGDLSRSIVDLIDKISQQIAVINKDRDELSRVSEYRRDFYNIVTHELKTPLTSIRGYAEVVRDNGFTDQAFFEQAMSHIIEESDRLHDMVVSLLEESKLKSPVEMPFDRVNVANVAKDVCESMQYKADKYGRHISFDADKEAYVLGNSEKLRELIINLLDNAIKYATDSEIGVGVAKDGEAIAVTVTNRTEMGADEDISHLFVPFYKSHASVEEKGSVGLGLSICKQIVEKHHGSIRLSVTDDQKLLAAVNLPAYGGL